MTQQAVSADTSEAAAPRVLYEKTGSGVALVTLNTPENLNALSQELMAELGAILWEIQVDTSVGCMVMTGSGRGFCPGGDIKGMRSRDGAARAGATTHEPGTELEQWEDHANQARRDACEPPQPDLRVGRAHARAGQRSGSGRRRRPSALPRHHNRLGPRQLHHRFCPDRPQRRLRHLLLSPLAGRSIQSERAVLHLRPHRCGDGAETRHGELHLSARRAA